jgi:transposase-like protein
MMSQGRYDKDFKRESVRLVLEGGYSQRQAAESVGVNVSTLKIWIDRLRHEFKQTPRKGGASSEAATIKRLA